MRVATAREQDIAAWLDLAAEVEPLFGPLVSEPGFMEALRRNVARETAFCARVADGPPGTPLAGALMFSPHPPQYRIGWLAVTQAWRRRGVGRALVEHVVGLIEPPAAMSVITFGAGTEGGEAARRFYARMGFAPAEMTSPGPEGGERQVFRRVFAAGPRLILVRHSLPDLDPAVAASRWHLSAEGRRRCQPLAQRLAPYAPDVVLSSVEPKAVETAQLVARVLGLPSKPVAGLHEHERSAAGLDRDQFYDAVARLFAEPQALVFGGETAQQARVRFATAVDGELARYPDANLVLVTHGTVLSLFVAHVTGVDGYRLWRQLGLPCFVVLSRPDLWLVEVAGEVRGSS